MTMMRLLFAILSLGALSACGAAPDRYTVATPAVTEQQRIAFGAVEVREVSLPAYAASDEIPLLDADGKVVSDGGIRMTIGSLGFATGQDLLDWLKSTNQQFNAAKVTQ